MIPIPRSKPTHIDERTQAVLRCIAVAGSVVLIGTLGFKSLECTWTYWDSFYFTLVTISTVGYGDYGISKESQGFAAFMLLCGIGAFTYSLSTVVHIASDVDASKRRKMKHMIANCHDHVIVCGYGRMGRMICDQIEVGGVSCVVIDNDKDSIETAKADGRLVVEGVASQDEVLLSAGVERASGVVCAVDSDAENMFITVTARSLNPCCRVISRAESYEAARKLEHAGASLVVSPHQMAGKTVATAILHPRLTRFLHTDEETSLFFELGEVVLRSGSEAIGQTVERFGAANRGVVFVAIERESGELIMQPGGETMFLEGDVVIFVGDQQAFDKMRSLACSSHSQADVPVGA